MAASEIQVKASAVGTREDLREVLAMGAAGSLHCEVSARRLEEIGEVLGQLGRGEIRGRVVLRLRN
jgi:alcohol dehydrogenase, propanol-preferring